MPRKRRPRTPEQCQAITDGNRARFQKQRDAGHPRYAFWKENDERLQELVNAGNTASQVAAELGCSKNAAIGRATRLNLTWARSAPPTSTLLTRLAALNAKMDALLEETRRPP